MEKYQYVRAFISAASEYTKHPSEAVASVLQRNLGVIGASLDLSIFDPGSSVAAELYVSLHELMSSLGSRTPLIWSALEVLQNASKNTTARQALIHTYKFAPILTRLLETNLTPEKRVKVLKLLQELTYGVKLSWQEAHLPYLISPLTQWVMQSKEEDVIALSLGILVNLCYKNLPAVYTLMRTVDTKTFLRTLLKLQNGNVNTRVQCLKMMIIMENGHKNISEKNVIEFVTTTFSTIVSSLNAGDVLLLRHVVDFFNDVRQSEHSRSVLLNYSKYASDVEKILTSIANNSNFECVALVMEFLLSLVSLKLSALIPLYPMCVKVAMAWVSVEQVCTNALAVIRTVIIDWRRMKGQTDILADLDLSVLLLVANCDDDSTENKDECEKDGTKIRTEKRSFETLSRLTELMQLLQEIARIPSMRSKIMQFFGVHTMKKLLAAILEEDDTTPTSDWPGNLFNDPSTSLYIHALGLAADLANHDSAWLTFYSEFLQKKQIHLIMALGLYTGDCEVKQKILKLSSSVRFPHDSVARCMRELEPLVLVQNSTGTPIPISGTYPSQCPSAEIAPLFSFNQESRLDAFLSKLDEAVDENRITDSTTSAVMELYDYKLAAMRHAERATQASLEAADKHATSLQHRLAQVVAESSRLHQLLFHNQQCLEGVRAEKAKLTSKICAQAVQIQEIPRLKKIVSDKSAVIERGKSTITELKKELEESLTKADGFAKKIRDLETELSTREAKYKELMNDRSEMKNVVAKLQENVNKKDNIIEEREREIAENQREILALKQEIDQLGRQCHIYEQTIAEKEADIQRMTEELVDLSRMRDMIYHLTAKKKEEPNSTT